MGSGSRPNNADDKMIAAIERGDQGEFQDRKAPKNTDMKLIKEKEARSAKSMGKTERLKALRLAAEKEGKAKWSQKTQYVEDVLCGFLGRDNGELTISKREG